MSDGLDSLFGQLDRQLDGAHTYLDRHLLVILLLTLEGYLEMYSLPFDVQMGASWASHFDQLKNLYYLKITLLPGISNMVSVYRLNKNFIKHLPFGINDWLIE